METYQLLEKIFAKLLEILQRLTAVETRVDVLVGRHNDTEGYFVQVVLMVVVAAFVFAFYRFKKRDKE